MDFKNFFSSKTNETPNTPETNETPNTPETNETPNTPETKDEVVKTKGSIFDIFHSKIKVEDLDTGEKKYYSSVEEMNEGMSSKNKKCESTITIGGDNVGSNNTIETNETIGDKIERLFKKR